MSQLLQVFILLPLIGFAVSLFVPKKKESAISGVALTVTGLHLLGVVAFLVYWLLNNHPVLDIKHIVFFSSANIEIFIDFYFDKVTATYALVGSLLCFLVTIFSKFYLHREEGYKRFFNAVLLFFLGYNIVIFSGNFETLFIGWELLGISSFLLIAFYRDRYLPVKNSLKVISVYRLGDICLILTMWMSHQLWHENITFMKLNDTRLVLDHLSQYQWYGYFIAFMIVLAAATKSAQLPFSSWLPRAMEGPTTSSAIFYGSLSVHLGVFLLLRTYPYWESLIVVKVLLIAIGLSTSIVAAGIARVQSSVKTQIAYSSIVQIGFIFIEVALGLHILALIHFAGNAFLRTYQLLVSPSVLSYLVHDMFFNFVPAKKDNSNSFWSRLKSSLYVLSIKEWNLDGFMYRYLWSPFKWVGRQFNFLSPGVTAIVLSLIFIAGIYIDLNPGDVSVTIYNLLPIVFSLLGLLLIIRSFTERGDAIKAWGLVIAGQLFITLSIALFHKDFGHDFMLIYLSGTIISAIVGYACLVKIRSIDNDIQLNRYHGYSYEKPKISYLFFIAALGVVGFPFTPTFIGIDILFSHIDKHEILLIVFTALSFIFMELAVLRIYARVFLGQHKKAYHPIAYRSS